MIEGGDRIAAGLPNPDGTRMTKDETAAPQMIGNSIATRLNTGTKADVRVTDSISTRNGKGMGSGLGRPLPSTHLEKRVSDRQVRADGTSVIEHIDDGAQDDDQIKNTGIRNQADGTQMQMRKDGRNQDEYRNGRTDLI